jgi:DUF4097 and DUF4098 domain-containing protein YvlB
VIIRAAALALALVLATASFAHAAIDRYVRIVPLPETRTLILDLTIGDVVIDGSARTDASIEIVRRAPHEKDLERIPVHVRESETEIHITATQRDSGTDPLFRTDVTLHLPRAARVGAVRVLEGRVTLASLHGAVTADVRRGSITASDVSGAMRLESGIGHIFVNHARLTAGGVLRLRTFNGDVKLSLAERPSDARILALALNGTIASDIPLTVKDRWGPRWGEATLGKGEPVISIDVITGTIAITVGQ